MAEVKADPIPPVRIADRRVRINTLYYDETLWAIDKPAKLLTIPDRWNPHLPNLLTLLRTHGWGKVYVVHRLDFDTSGVVLFARTPVAHRELCLQFERRQVFKRYLAVVSGEVAVEEGGIDQPLTMRSRKKGLMCVDPKGKPAVTRFRVVQRFHGATLLEVMPETGRMHQIRVHLQSIGHPLLVDPKYGGLQAVFLSDLKPGYRPKREEEERPIMDRVTLHAATLRFIHPGSGEEVTLTSDLPKDLRLFLRNLERYGVPQKLGR